MSHSFRLLRSFEPFVLIFILCQMSQVSSLSIPSYGFYRRDVDIQSSIIGILSSLDRNCPIVLIFDEILPKPASSRILSHIQRKSNHQSVFIILDLSQSKLDKLEPIYGTRDYNEVFIRFLHILYRRSSCYTFIIWISDPRLLDTHSSVSIHPGWRSNDIVLLPTHHISKRYKYLISQPFWFNIPNIIALKRKDDQDHVSDQVRIFTVIPYFSRKRSKSQELDVWLVKQNEFLYKRQLFFDKFTTFNWAPLTIGLFWKEPFLIWGSYENPYLDGLDWRLLMMCGRHLNFTLSTVQTTRFGRLQSGTNGSWNGMMGLLKNNEIDIGIGGVAMYSEIMESFGFTKTFYTDQFTFISPISKKVTSSWNSFSKPFQDEVWIAAGVTLTLASVVLRIVSELQMRTRNEKGKTKTQKKNMDSEKTNPFRSTINVVGFMITLICQRPYRYSPKELPIQFVFYAMIMCNFILGILFSSCLTAYLFKFRYKPMAERIDDILGSGLSIFIRNYDGYLEHFLQASEDPTLSTIFKFGKRDEWNSTVNDEVVCGNAVHIDSRARLMFTGRYRYMGAKGLKFHIGLDNIVDHVTIGWPVRKNWPFQKKFDDIINRAVENGFTQHWMERLMEGEFGWDDEAWKIPELFTHYLNKRERRVKDFDPSLILDQRFVPLSVPHFNGIFSLYIVGMTLAVFCFIAELFLFYIYRAGKSAVGFCGYVGGSHKFANKTPTTTSSRRAVVVKRFDDSYSKKHNSKQSLWRIAHKSRILQREENAKNNNKAISIIFGQRNSKQHFPCFPEIFLSDFESCGKKTGNMKKFYGSQIKF